MFEAKRRDAKFCSAACRKAATRSGQLVKVAAPPPVDVTALLTAPVPDVVKVAVEEHRALKTRIASLSKPLFPHCRHCRPDGHGEHLDACRQGCT